MNKFIVFIIFITSISVYAHDPEPGKVFGMLGPFLRQTHGVYSQDIARSPVTFGIGITAEADLNTHGGLEAGIFYFPKIYQRVNGSTHIISQINKLDLNLGYRYWIFNRISLGVSFVSAISVGDALNLYSDVAPPFDYTSAQDITEYGSDFSLQWEWTTIERFAIVLDLRFFHSFSAKPNEDADQFGSVIGLKYRVQ